MKMQNLLAYARHRWIGDPLEDSGLRWDTGSCTSDGKRSKGRNSKRNSAFLISRKRNRHAKSRNEISKKFHKKNCLKNEIFDQKSDFCQNEFGQNSGNGVGGGQK